MENYKAGKSSGIKFLIIILVLFLIVISFFAGFYAGVDQKTNQQNSASFGDVINKATSVFDDNDEIDINLFLKVWNNVTEKYVDRPVNDQDLFYGALKGMIRSLGDPYSIFLDPEETENFTQELSGSFEGIGAEIGIKNDQLTVIAALPNTPAYNAGLKAGDKILKINDFDTIDMSLDMAVSLIRGPQETVVVLTILSSNNDEINEISITRNIIDVESVTWEILDDNIAYIELIHFNSDTYSDFKKIANEIILKNPNGIVLDLRSNPGGYLDNAIDVAGEFLEDKVIVIEDFGDSREEYKSGNNAKLKDIPMVVLVDAGSASASEIVAGAMQDYDRATIVGEMTFGKGSVQDFEEYIDGSSLKITVAKWLTPNGISIEDEGIIPDVEIINTEEDFNNNQDPQLDKALEILKQ